MLSLQRGACFLETCTALKREAHSEVGEREWCSRLSAVHVILEVCTALKREAHFEGRRVQMSKGKPARGDSGRTRRAPRGPKGNAGHRTEEKEDAEGGPKAILHTLQWF